MGLWSDEGVGFIYRGFAFNTLSVMHHYAWNFAFKELFKRYFGWDDPRFVPAHDIVAGNFQAGALAGCASLVLTYPISIPKIALANTYVQNSNPSYATLVKLLYGRGFGYALVASVTFRAISFGIYDSFKPVGILSPKVFEGERLGAGMTKAAYSFALAWIATVVGQIASTPITMLQSDSVKFNRGFVGALRNAHNIHTFSRLVRMNSFVGSRSLSGAVALVLFDYMSLLLSGKRHDFEE